MHYLTLLLLFLSLFFWRRERKTLHLLILRIQEILLEKDQTPSLEEVVLGDALEDEEEIFVVSDTGQVFTKDIILSDPESCRLVMESDRLCLSKTISLYLSLICLAFSIPM